VSKKTALITGITGQDGGYLAKLLLEKGYRVVGCHRRGSTEIFSNLKYQGIEEDIELAEFDLLEDSNIARVIKKFKPDEFYNLAAQSFVGTSFEQPLYTANADGLGVTRILEAIREYSPATRFYQASTSEMYGMVQEIPQKETTPFYPRSPYAAAKLYAHWMTVNYRESYGLHTSSGILFNHESPFRGREFVTRKTTSHLARIATGQTQKPLQLGNLNAKRDWGFAGDYVEAMWLMLQQEQGDTYVVATGETYTVSEFIERAAKYAGFALEWQGEDKNKRGVDTKSGKLIVEVNADFYRPAEVDLLIGSPSKAEEKLGWKRKVDFDSLCEMMMKSDLDRASKNLL
jgi:GDPmannose 4,6-dehydratase